MTGVLIRPRPVEAAPSLDYPRRGERIVSESYTLRLGAPPGVKRVEISIDEGRWRPCRHAAGYWWYDWSGYESGRYEVVARLETRDGRLVVSEPSKLLVELPV